MAKERHDTMVEARDVYVEKGYVSTGGEDGESITMYKPWPHTAPVDCAHVVIWPRPAGGVWSEEY